jgi:hypothetical protein
VARVAEVASQVGLAELASILATPMTADASSDGALARREVDWAFPKHAEFRTLILDSGLQALISELIGQPGYLVRDQVFLKSRGSGLPSPGTRTSRTCR